MNSSSSGKHTEDIQDCMSQSMAHTVIFHFLRGSNKRLPNVPKDIERDIWI